MPITANQKTVLLTVVGGVALLVLAVFLWWNFIHQGPHRVFESMLTNNLRTSSVTKYEKTSNGSQTAQQYVRLQLGGTNAAQWLVSISQPGLNVTTESIGTPTTGYVRYVNATSGKKDANGKAVDFSSILNIWGKAAPKEQSSLTQLFSQSILDIGTVPAPPIGNVTPEQQENITTFMSQQGVFTPNYQTMQRKMLDGREVYVYDVSVKLAPYVRMMQVFASNIGLKDLQSLDPTQYQSAQPIKLTMSVDASSHQLKQITYAQSGFTETYSDYGLSTPIAVPGKTIPASELQSRLQKL
ncbi:MAG: hypothetical protein ABIR37_00460 [Candidatus Saccharimonadales bacterium]